jgi:hypothetical protein
MADETDVRIPLLMRLAEQAMSDPDFRAVAREDLDRALAQYGYELNAKERTLVFRFRAALEEAGIDLDLTKELDVHQLMDNPTVRQLLKE